jgi:lipopolysaccharide/colanic/teichoic acid biosynthesis glycosyltransferase
VARPGPGAADLQAMGVTAGEAAEGALGQMPAARRTTTATATAGGYPGRYRTSRLLDLAVAVPVLVLASPLILGLALLIRLRMGSPVLFRQERAGRGARVFELVKFRTMRPAARGDDGPESDGDRLTPLGRALRSTSLDELPTLLNVVGGDMSLVGPRPLPVRYLPRYSPRHARRHEVRPGITGWAQVNGRNALSWDDQLDMDVWYVEQRSLSLDLRIIRNTVASVVRREGISADGHATRPEFPGSGAGRATFAGAQRRPPT